MIESRHTSVLGTLALLTTTFSGSAALAQSSSEFSLTTTFASNNGFSGNIFNVNVLGESLMVTGLNVNLEQRSSGSHIIEVYTREGTFQGAQTDPAGWVLVSTTAVTSAGSDTPTFVDVDDFVLPGEETTGIIVFLANYESGGIRYTNGTGATIVASNADLEITDGVGVSDVLFSRIFSPRTWNGTIFYDLFLPVTEQMAALAQSTSTFARRIVTQASGIAATRINQGLTNDMATRFGPFMDGETPISSWFEVTGYALNGDDMQQTARGFQLGADINVMPNLAVGLSFGRSEMTSQTTDFNVDGVLSFVQPYLGYVNGPLRLDASLFYGAGTFEQKTEFESGKADATVRAATVIGAYDKVLSDSTTLTAMASLTYGSEELKGASGSLADAETETVDFGQASMGARYTTTTKTGLVYAGLHAEYDYGDQDMTVLSGFDDDEGWGARLEVGTEFLINDQFEVDFSMSVGGIGKSTTDIEAGLMLSMSL